MKEYLNIPVSSFPVYRYLYHSQKIENEPLLRVVTAHFIHSHCIIVPFKEESCYILQIIHPSDWANKFLDFN